MEIRIKFGQRVRKFRKLRGFSQEELAYEAGSNRTYVSDVERGTRNPSLDFIARVSSALNVKMGELLD